MTRTATGTGTRPCPTADPVGLYSLTAGVFRTWLLLTSLALLTLCLLSPRSAHAQGGYPGGGSGYPGGGSGSGGSGGYPGGGWSVLDQNNTAINPNQDGSGYPLKGVLKGAINGSCTLTGAYQDMLAASQQPNPTVGYAFAPNPISYQGWLFSGGAIPAGGDYNPYAVWTSADARNYVSSSGGMTGWLGDPLNEAINGSVTSNTSGTLWAIFQWNGTQPPVDHLDILLQTTVSASAGTAGNGLSSSATATDSTFGETASAPTGTPLVKGKHLLRVAVDPSKKQALVSLGGNVMATATNSLPFGVMGNYPGTTSGGYYQQTNGPAETSSGAYISAAASIDSREVGITCLAIEDSYYKGAYDSQHGSDRYQHVHQPSENSVDSVVFQQNDLSTGQHFVAGHAYDSNAIGFISPVFNWTIAGDGSPDANTSADLGPNPSNPYGLANLPANLDFGATWDTTQTKSSQFKVDVEDSDGADASDTYSVTWHAPQEKFTVLSYQKDVPKLVGSLQPITVNATAPSNLTIPGQEGEIDWGGVQQQAGLPVAVAGAGAGALLLIPEVAAGPAGWVVIGAQAVAAGASYKLGMSSPDHPGTVPIQGNADYNEYCADVNHQVTINTDPNAAGDLVRFIPASLASQAQAAEMNPAHWSSDPYFMNSTAMWQGGWYTDIKDLDGDGYDVHGYTGHVPGHTEVATHLFKYFNWTCTYSQPPTH